MPRFGVDSLAFLLSTITGTLVLAACSNALRIRNHDVGTQSRAAAARGIKLILNTDTLTNPGWALSVGGGGIAVSSLLILLHSMHLQPPTKFAMKVLFLSPVFLALNTLLLTAAAIPVAYYGKNGTTTAEAYIGGARLPDSIVRSQAEASGISLDFWQHGYVKFMVICGIVCIPFAFVTTYFSYKIWRNERHGNNVVQQHQAPGHLSNESGDFNEKNASEVQHIA